MVRAKRVLFFAEAVTLAHVARPVVLAKGLETSLYEVVMACDTRYQRFLNNVPWRTVPLHSVGSEQFLHALASGRPVYDVPTLRRYVADDLGLIERFAPDLIVGDFRLSLSVSARLAKVPYATITNAYWSPHYQIRAFPLPALPLTRWLPLPIARQVFALAQPAAFAMHCRPLNQVRHEHGLPSLGSDLRRAYTDADHVVYGDSPAMFDMNPMPPNHHFLGPILWSPPGPLPKWWDALPDGKPIVYLTLGSSGASHLAALALSSLGDMPVTVIASMAGAKGPRVTPANVFTAEYLPGIEAAARSALVICNGGSPTSQQALAAAVPVLGVASNMDQFLNMQAVAAAGAGVILRADRADSDGMLRAASAMLATASFKDGASRLARHLASHDATNRFAGIVADILGRPPRYSRCH